MKILNKCFLCLCLVLISSCTLYPRYSRPQMTTPAAWRFTTTEESGDYSNLSWWKHFGDEVLDEYIMQALAYNQNLIEAMYRVDEYVARLGIVRSELYPQLSADIEAGRNKISTTLSPVTPGAQAISNAYVLLLNASYQLDIWGKIRSASDAAKASLFSQIQNRRTVVLTLVSAVASSYVNLRRLDKQLYIAQETLRTRNESYYLAVVRFELGITSQIQVEQAKSEVEATEIAVERLELEIALEEDALSILLGKPPADVKRGKDLDDLVMSIKVPVFSPAELFNQRPDILSSEQELISANADIGVARARFFPQIAAVGAIGTESSFFSQLFQGPSGVWQYGLTLLQEIFTGGRLTSGLKLTKAQKMEKLYAYESTVLNAFKEVNDALISHRKTLEILAVQRERVETLASYFYLATLRYNEGETDYLTYLDAERQFFQAQIECAGAQGDSFLALIDIYKSLGGGWVLEADSESLKMNNR